MTRRLTPLLTFVALMAGMTITAPLARADVVDFNLSSPAFTGMPGQTVEFFGTISAPSANTGVIDLLGLNITFGDNLGGPWLAFNNIDPTPFYNLPEFLNPGDALTDVRLFTATIDPSAPPHVFGIVKVNLVALDAAGGDVSTTAQADAQIVPEPASVFLLGAAVIGLGGMIRRQRQVR